MAHATKCGHPPCNRSTRSATGRCPWHQESSVGRMDPFAAGSLRGAPPSASAVPALPDEYLAESVA